MPGFVIIAEVIFKRPGTASIFTPHSGTPQECNTSLEVIKKRNDLLIGTTNILFVVSNRFWPIIKSEVATELQITSFPKCL